MVDSIASSSITVLQVENDPSQLQETNKFSASFFKDLLEEGQGDKKMIRKSELTPDFVASRSVICFKGTKKVEYKFSLNSFENTDLEDPFKTFNKTTKLIPLSFNQSFNKHQGSVSNMILQTPFTQRQSLIDAFGNESTDIPEDEFTRHRTIKALNYSNKTNTNEMPFLKKQDSWDTAEENDTAENVQFGKSAHRCSMIKRYN
jgi:hypothetical protein